MAVLKTLDDFQLQIDIHVVVYGENVRPVTAGHVFSQQRQMVAVITRGRKDPSCTLKKTDDRVHNCRQNHLQWTLAFLNALDIGHALESDPTMWKRALKKPCILLKTFMYSSFAYFYRYRFLPPCSHTTYAALRGLPADQSCSSVNLPRLPLPPSWSS